MNEPYLTEEERLFIIKNYINQRDSNLSYNLQDLKENISEITKGKFVRRFDLEVMINKITSSLGIKSSLFEFPPF